MAQTITIQRGLISATSGSTTLLFTQSASGTASRLVVGYLTVTSSNAIQPFASFAVLPSGQSSPNFSVFAACNAAADGTGRLFSATPHDAGGFYVDTYQNQKQPIFYNNLQNITLTRSTWNTSGSAVPTKFFYNSNVMIGPSDSVHVGYSDPNGGLSASIIYCFVIITES